MPTKWPEFSHQNPNKCRRPEVTVSSCPPPRPKQTDHAHTDMIITKSKIVKLKGEKKNNEAQGWLVSEQDKDMNGTEIGPRQGLFKG